jgi:SAM-dependent methyltransferase
MATDAEQHPERIDIEDSRGSLVASEHLARYLWSAQLVRGRSVLDAGCGTGYGITALAHAGARRLVGVDISKEAVERASESNADLDVEIRRDDIEALPFADREFDVVVCFEVIEHVEEPEAVLDELARVLAHDGILCISTPNRRVYPPGNPYHLHEYEPQEFEEALAKRFSHVELHRQSAWLASTILSDEEFSVERVDAIQRFKAVTTEAKEPGDETFTVALASRHEIPPVESLLTLGERFEVLWWEDQVQKAHATGLETAHQARDREATALREEAFAAEREAATLRQAIAGARESNRRSAQRVVEVEEVLAKLNARIFALEEVVDEIQPRLERADLVMSAIKASVSWRITAPLRALRRRR